MTFFTVSGFLFLPTPSARRATQLGGGHRLGLGNFYPRPPRGGRRLCLLGRVAASANFYPRPPRGGRQLISVSPGGRDGFLPTPSARRATICISWLTWARVRFLPTPSARRATAVDRARPRVEIISTHALREEGDPSLPDKAPGVYISTHALREEGDKACGLRRPAFIEFLPTPSARRATCVVGDGGRAHGFLPTPSARRATLYLLMGFSFLDISTHALREEGDHPRTRSAAAKWISTHALREEGDAATRPRRHKRKISTHALREEGDQLGGGHRLGLGNFYPRPPRGGRPAGRTESRCSSDFYPRPPRGGRRQVGKYSAVLAANFYPRPPRGGRQTLQSFLKGNYEFLPTPSARRATRVTSPFCMVASFLPTPSARRATYRHRQRQGQRADFYPRPPRGGRQRS